MTDKDKPHLTSEDLDKITPLDDEIFEEEKVVPFGSQPPEEDEESAVYVPPLDATVFKSIGEVVEDMAEHEPTPTDKATMARVNLEYIVKNMGDELEKIDKELVNLEARRNELLAHRQEVERTMAMIVT